jgi:hypothetical protein
VKFHAKAALQDLFHLLQLLWRMTVLRPDLRRFFWKTFADTACHSPRALEPVISLMLLYLHLGASARPLVTELDKKIAAIRTKPQPEVIAAFAFFVE